VVSPRRTLPQWMNRQTPPCICATSLVPANLLPSVGSCSHRTHPSPAVHLFSIPTLGRAYFSLQSQPVSDSLCLCHLKILIHQRAKHQNMRFENLKRGYNRRAKTFARWERRLSGTTISIYRGRTAINTYLKLVKAVSTGRLRRQKEWE